MFGEQRKIFIVSEAFSMKKLSIIAVLIWLGIMTAIPLGLPRHADAGAVKSVVLYIPNRVFDMLDIVRLRLRLGPGLSAGVSATELADVFVGAHTSVYAGLRGSRGKPEIPWPFGIEKRAGAEVSIADATASNVHNDLLGFGAETQLGIIGINAAIEGYDILDLITGFFFIDFAKDDF
jgi:hypothetical protein